jgi:hypothetical protein
LDILRDDEEEAYEVYVLDVKLKFTIDMCIIYNVNMYELGTDARWIARRIFSATRLYANGFICAIYSQQFFDEASLI